MIDKNKKNTSRVGDSMIINKNKKTSVRHFKSNSTLFSRYNASNLPFFMTNMRYINTALVDRMSKEDILRSYEVMINMAIITQNKKENKKK